MLYRISVILLMLSTHMALFGGPVKASRACRTDEAGCQGQATLGNVEGSAPKYFTLFYARGGIKNIMLQPKERTQIYVYEGDTICIGTEGKPPDLDHCKRLPIPVDEIDVR